MPRSMGVGCSLEAFLLKLGLHGRGYRSRSFESGVSKPLLERIPHDLLASALDTPSGVSRFCLRATPRFDPPTGCPWTRLLKSDCRTLLLGQSALSRDFVCSLHRTYLVVEGDVVAVCLLAHWARLFRR